MTTPNPLVVRSRDAEGVLALWARTVLIQLRRGPLTLGTLESAAAALREVTVQGRPLGALLIVEAGAPIPSEEVRQAQRALFRDLTNHEHVRVAAVILGDDLTSTLQRSAGRMVAVGNPRVQRFESVAAAAVWLAEDLTSLGATTTATELVAAVEQLRG